jgi:hypothetical protein
VVRTAEAILRTSAVSGEPNALSRWSLEPGRQGEGFVPGEPQVQDVSSLATLWMARYLIRLGRETGQGRHWNRALAMLDVVLARLLPLGLSMRTAPRTGDQAARFVSGTNSGVWSLHAMLIEAMLDLAGLEYSALDRRLTLDPVLPSAWPQTGLTQTFACGDVAYRLERPIGGTVHQLSLKARLSHPVALQAGITCPGLSELGPWRSVPDLPPPGFDPRTGRLTWTAVLPAGESVWSCTWG